MRPRAWQPHLPPLARDGVLPPNDMADFFESPRALRPGRCIMSLNVKKPLPAEIRQLVLARLDDSSAEVRQAAVLAAGVLKLREAVPRLIQTAGAGQADSDLRTQAITALCMMPDPRAEAIYRQAAAIPIHRSAARVKRPFRPSAGRSIRKSHSRADPPRERPTSRACASSPSVTWPIRKKGKSFSSKTGRSHAADVMPRRGAEPGTSGPDLSGLASRSDKVQLIRSLLEPSPRVAAAHQPVKNLVGTLTPLSSRTCSAFSSG